MEKNFERKEQAEKESPDEVENEFDWAKTYPGVIILLIILNILTLFAFFNLCLDHKKVKEALRIHESQDLFGSNRLSVASSRPFSSTTETPNHGTIDMESSPDIRCESPTKEKQNLKTAKLRRR